uniref:Uncharacterized protein LOC102808431 n=1 Tax=Saccoglossus kowalevskii TaxID=10224 RepID=A0ABM0LU67_SACKO|nr:PREDICTED: uncharacterized protein LOC102808431 [Saccoglossus kowalevskii]
MTTIHAYTFVNTANLEILLKEHFNDFRRHDINITAKYAVRDFIRDRFVEYGLDVSMHEFATRKPEFTGSNVIGILNGQKAMTSDDKIVLLGSHYDTADTTPGVDDNGSGMALLLETARVVTSHCNPEYTIIFVAFDYAEFTVSWADDPCYWNVPCGSQRFVEDWLVSFLQDRDSPEFQGAFIADTLMNWDDNNNTQDLPGAFNVLFTDTYTRIRDNGFRGDFLFVYSRPEDATLMETFASHYNSQDGSAYRIECLLLPITGQPTTYQERFYTNQLRSDHHNFWRNSNSFKAVQLTDSANFRGYMQSCHHRLCDDVNPITPEIIQFLAKTTKAIVATLLEMSATPSYCPDGRGNPPSTISLRSSKEPTTLEAPKQSTKTTELQQISKPARVTNTARTMTFNTIVICIHTSASIAIYFVYTER